MYRLARRQLAVCTVCVLLGGCMGIGGGTDPEAEPVLRMLAPIEFGADVPQEMDPVTLAIDTGSVTFFGGMAGTRRILPLYFDDSFAWNLNGGSAEIAFDGLDVKAVRFYFAHQGAAGSTMNALSLDGETIGTVASFPAANLGDPNAVFEIDAGELSISRLVIESEEGAIASLDHLILSVPE